MWQLDNRTPFAAERTWVRGRDGAEIWLVVVRGAFDILADGSLRLAAEQPPVVAVPEPLDPAARAASSLKYECDLVRIKPTTDILLLGHARSPAGQAVPALEVAFRVGPVTKALKVTGDRYWMGQTASEPKPFVTMPLCYERAYGGLDPQTRDTELPQWDPRNPVGTGFGHSPAGLDGVRLPNIEYRDQLIRRPSDRPAPAGTGPIAANWEPRAALAGTYDAHWQEERFPLLPDDFDDRHYQCAPRDQQAPRYLAGGEPVVLINLAPAPELRFSLPAIHLGLETFFYDGQRELHEPPRLHSVILEPDEARVSLVWHSALPCHPKVYKLDRTRIILKRLVGVREPNEREELEFAQP